MGEVKLAACDPKMLEVLWPHARRFLLQSYVKNDQTVPHWLLEDIRLGRRVLWLLIKDNIMVGAGTTAIFEMVSGRLCKIEHFAGSGMDEWSHLRTVIEEYAKREGCARVMCEGRPGWQRILTDYEVTAVVLEKRL